jgi:hypothetical protein
MLPAEVVFPKFVPDQLLTSEDLNRFFGYLDEQNRMTRTNLLGIGIVCGLQLHVNNASTAVTITRGCGVTSEGYLIAVDTRTYSQYKPYDVNTKRVYDRFFKTDGGGNKVPMEIWELKQPGVDPDLKPIDESFLKGKVILLFVELKEEENKNCDPNSCDDKGINVTVSFLPMAVSIADAMLLMGTTAGAFGASTYTTLPEVRMRRWDVPNSSPVSTKDIFKAYLDILHQPFLDGVEQTLKNIYVQFGALFNTDFPTNPFNGLAAQFSFLHNGTINGQQLIHLQYYYDLFSDLQQAYQEFRVAGTHVLSTCCPDSQLFPRHLLLGEAVPAVQTSTVAYRHYFIYSPLFDKGQTIAELKMLFRRLVLLKERYFLPPISGNNLKEDTHLRITPSMLWKVPLSQKAIPYYYQVNTGAHPLYLSWDYRRTLLNDAHRNLSYHANQYNAADSFVLKPLQYDLEPYNFLRIEGIVGKSYTHVLRQVKNQIQQNRLPVDIIALSTTDSIRKITENLRSFDRTVEAHEMLCYFQDLESMYDSMRREILCTLCKELKYYYDFTIKTVNAFFKRLNVGGEPSQVKLFNVCANGYQVKNNSFGVLIEVLHRQGLTDETLTIVNYFEAFGVNLMDANNDDLPDGFSENASAIMLAMLNFFKVPLGIIRLSTLLTEDLSEFDAKAYCDAAQKLAGYAEALKSLFALFTGGSALNQSVTKEDTGNIAGVNTDSANPEIRKSALSNNNKMLAAISGSQNTMLRILAAILMIEDFFDHLDVLIYNCKCSALLSLKKDYMQRYAMLTRLRQFGYFTKMHPGIQHKAGVPMGGTFIIVYHTQRQATRVVNDNFIAANRRDSFNTFDSAETSFAKESFDQPSIAKNVSIAGRVVDENNEPIPGAKIVLLETGQGTVTDADGRFKMTGKVIPYTLVVSALGYEEHEEVKTDDDTNMLVRLRERRGDILDEIPEGAVIADFYLPYRCCSDCPPIQYIINEKQPPPPPPNKGPVAVAGPDQEITLPENKVQLNGSASTDPDGVIVVFQWAKLSGPGNPTIVTPNSAITDVVDLEEGTYVFELSVTDDSGNVARDTMVVKVNPAPPPKNKPPVAEAGPDATIPMSANGATAILDGSQSKDEDGQVVGFSWSQVSGNPAIITFPDQAQSLVTFNQPGTYVFRLKVVDDDGETAEDTVTIVVTRPENKPPNAVAGPVQDILVTGSTNNEAILDGSNSSDPEGGLLTYQWKFESGPNTPVIVNADLAVTKVTGLVEGEYKFSLTVKDNTGQDDTDTTGLRVKVNLEKQCGPLPEITDAFRKLDESLSVDLRNNLTEVFQDYKIMQEYFEKLSQMPANDIAVQLEFFGELFNNQDTQALLVGWLNGLHKIILERKDLRNIALRLYRIIVMLAMYIVCIQKEDFDRAKVAMNRVFSVMRKHFSEWMGLINQNVFTNAEKVIVANIRNDMQSEDARTKQNGEESTKVNYLKALAQLISIIVGV